MRIGFALPTIGPTASPEAIVEVARRAEALGYDDLWVADRLLYPLAPRTPYLGTPDGSLPVVYQRVLEPLDALSFAAAHTERVGLGTSVLNIPFYNPVLLARRLTTIDQLSHGRLRLGLGLGWSEDEFEATGADFKQRGARSDEFLALLKTIWTSDPVEYNGKFFKVARSIIQPKPVQRPHPPIYLAAFAPAALARVARHANGWLPAGLPVDLMGQMMASIRSMAAEAGRDPSMIELVVRANLDVRDEPRGEAGGPFSGTLEQIAADIKAVRALGASDLHFDPTFSPDSQSREGYLRNLERMYQLAQESA